MFEDDRNNIIFKLKQAVKFLDAKLENIYDAIIRNERERMLMKVEQNDYLPKWQQADNIETKLNIKMSLTKSDPTPPQMILISEREDFITPNVSKLPYTQKSFDYLFDEARNGNLVVCVVRYHVEYYMGDACNLYLDKRQNAMDDGRDWNGKVALIAEEFFTPRRLAYIRKAGAEVIGGRGIGAEQDFDRYRIENDTAKARITALWDTMFGLSTLARYLVGFHKCSCPCSGKKDNDCFLQRFDDEHKNICMYKDGDKCKSERYRYSTEVYSSIGGTIFAKFHNNMPDGIQKIFNEAVDTEAHELISKMRMYVSFRDEDEERKKLSKLFTKDENFLSERILTLAIMMKTIYGVESYHEGLLKLTGLPAPEVDSIRYDNMNDEILTQILEVMENEGIDLMFSAIADGVPYEDVIA